MTLSRPAATVLVAAGGWTLFVWLTRIWNLLGDSDHTAAFKAVHSLLALVSIGFGIALLAIGTRGLRTRTRV